LHVESVFVEENYRHRGLGRFLLNKVEAYKKHKAQFFFRSLCPRNYFPALRAKNWITVSLILGPILQN
jgi:GNAT superfamily N-acetyltransferase